MKLTIKNLKKAFLAFAMTMIGTTSLTLAQFAPPVADAGSDIIATFDPQTGLYTALLDGTGSIDPQGFNLSYNWQGDFLEAPVFLATNLVTFLPGGPYTVTLTVTNSAGLESAPDTVNVTLIQPVDIFLVSPAQDLTVEKDASGNQSQLNAWLASSGGAFVAGGNFTTTNDFSPPTPAPDGSLSVTVTWTFTPDEGATLTSTATFRATDSIPPAVSFKVDGVPVSTGAPVEISVKKLPVTVTIDAIDLSTIASRSSSSTAGKGVKIKKVNATTYIIREGGVGKTATFTASATDAAGNVGSDVLNIQIVKAPKRPKCDGRDGDDDRADD